MDEWMHVRPHWLVRKGNFILLGLLCFFLLCSTAIPYPDTVEGPIRLVPSEGASSGYYGLIMVSGKDSKKIRRGQEVLVRHVGENQAGIRCHIGTGPWTRAGADSLWVKVDMPPMAGEGRELVGTVMTQDGSLLSHMVAATNMPRR